MKHPLFFLFTVILLTVNAVWADSLKSDSFVAKKKYIEELEIVEQGDAAVQATLGDMYYRGEGVEKNYAEAVKWCRLAAAQGNASAQFRLGYMYYRGKGVAQNYAEAVKWYRLAAEQGDARAQSNLGVMYEDGYGIGKNLVRAHMWLNLGATSGSEIIVKNRDRLAKQMTVQQLEQAQKMARDCQKNNFQGCD